MVILWLLLDAAAVVVVVVLESPEVRVRIDIVVDATGRRRFQKRIECGWADVWPVGRGQLLGILLVKSLRLTLVRIEGAQLILSESVRSRSGRCVIVKRGRRSG